MKIEIKIWNRIKKVGFFNERIWKTLYIEFEKLIIKPLSGILMETVVSISYSLAYFWLHHEF